MIKLSWGLYDDTALWLLSIHISKCKISSFSKTIIHMRTKVLLRYLCIQGRRSVSHLIKPRPCLPCGVCGGDRQLENLPEDTTPVTCLTRRPSLWPDHMAWEVAGSSYNKLPGTCGLRPGLYQDHKPHSWSCSSLMLIGRCRYRRLCRVRKNPIHLQKIDIIPQGLGLRLAYNILK